jgi:hypothetical protein
LKKQRLNKSKNGDTQRKIESAKEVDLTNILPTWRYLMLRNPFRSALIRNQQVAGSNPIAGSSNIQRLAG